MSAQKQKPDILTLARERVANRELPPVILRAHWTCEPLGRDVQQLLLDSIRELGLSFVCRTLDMREHRVLRAAVGAGVSDETRRLIMGRLHGKAAE